MFVIFPIKIYIIYIFIESSEIQIKYRFDGFKSDINKVNKINIIFGFKMNMDLDIRIQIRY